MSSGQDGTASVVVGTTAFLELPGDEAVLVVADLEYRPGDCWAVRLVLRGPDGVGVCWTFAWNCSPQTCSALEDMEMCECGHCAEGPA
jgi:hypothetical protein